MIRLTRPRRRAALGAFAFLASMIAPPRAHAVALFSATDASTLVFRGRVEQVTAYPTVKLQVYRLRVTRALKGDVAKDETVDLAQEMLFAATKPYFAEGVETLIFAVPLPSYSSFESALPAGRYWRWTERLDTAANIAPLADPGVADAVARYLTVRDDAEASASFVVDAIVHGTPYVSKEALAVVSVRRDVVPLLDAGRLQPLAGWLRDDTRPVAERAAVLVQLAHVKAPGAVELARELADRPGPMQAPALDALIAVGASPPPEHLVALSRSRDEPLRLVAGRGLATLDAPVAVDRIAEMLGTEQSTNVRLAILRSLGRAPNPRVVRLLDAELRRPDKEVAMAAADALTRQATPEAIAVLEKVVDDGPDNSRLAAAFALKRIDSPETDEILARLERSHPDPNVRRLCKLARGEDMHEH